MRTYCGRSAAQLGGALLWMVFGANPARAWGPTGHRVVAAIAWQNMTPAARSQAIAILMKAAANTGIAALRPTTGTAAERDAFFFAEVATWPDLVRSGPRKPLFHHAAWHFADHFWSTVNGKPKEDTTKGPAAENAFERLTHFERALKADHTAKPDNAIALAWMLHLMGDLHQPLHNAARETKAFPNGDRGGNDFRLDGKMELHKYWDDIPDEMFAADHTILVPPVRRNCRARLANLRERVGATDHDGPSQDRRPARSYSRCVRDVVTGGVAACRSCVPRREGWHRTKRRLPKKDGQSVGVGDRRGRVSIGCRAQHSS